MDKTFLALSAVTGLVGVGTGAFGAHALRGRLSPEMMAVFQTGVQYHLIHALALGLVAVIATRWPGTSTTVAGWLFFAGIIVFSGSLYALATTGLRALGAVTPLGGLCLMGGWASLLVTALRTPG